MNLHKTQNLSRGMWAGPLVSDIVMTYDHRSRSASAASWDSSRRRCDRRTDTREIDGRANRKRALIEWSIIFGNIAGKWNKCLSEVPPLYSTGTRWKYFVFHVSEESQIMSEQDGGDISALYYINLTMIINWPWNCVSRDRTAAIMFRCPRHWCKYKLLSSSIISNLSPTSL